MIPKIMVKMAIQIPTRILSRIFLRRSSTRNLIVPKKGFNKRYRETGNCPSNWRGEQVIANITKSNISTAVAIGFESDKKCIVINENKDQIINECLKMKNKVEPI